ncbi:transcription factor IIIC subunit delta N-term-domain-containing protein [Cladochytrium replicatum]|nr:transcription factor IIIC subunit delta N-term-domain-containing protein [Cladochytrium replicatum]
MIEPLKVSGFAEHPQALKWSDDNQIAVVTSQVIHIVTPSLRGWKTSLKASKDLIHRTIFFSPSQDKRQVNLIYSDHVFDMDDFRPGRFEKEGFRSAAWSHTGTSSNEGCLLAVLQYNHVITIYGPTGNPYDGDWKPIQDLTDLIYRRNFDYIQELPPLFALDRLEAVSLEWSHVLRFEHFGVSLIAAAMKDGSLALFCHAQTAYLIDQIELNPPGKIVALAFSKWSLRRGVFVAYMLTGTLDGQACCWEVNFVYSTDEADTKVQIQLLKTLANADGREVTMAHFYCENEEGAAPADIPKLAFTKGSRLYVWFPVSHAGEGSEQIHPDPFCVNLPLSMPATGMLWNSDGSRIHLYTMDGKVWAISAQRGSPTPPSFVDDHTGTLSRHIFSVTNMDDLADHDDGDGGKESGSKEVAEVTRTDLRQGARISFHGAGASFSGLAHCILTRITWPLNNEYRTFRNEYSLVIFIDALQLEDIGMDFVSDLSNKLDFRLRRILADSNALIVRNPICMIWDLLESRWDILAHLLQKVQELCVPFGRLLDASTHQTNVHEELSLLGYRRTIEYTQANTMRFAYMLSNVAKGVMPSIDNQSPLNNLVHSYERSLAEFHLSWMIQLFEHFATLYSLNSTSDVYVLNALCERALLSERVAEFAPRLLALYITTRSQSVPEAVQAVCDLQIELIGKVMLEPSTPVQPTQSCPACNTALTAVSLNKIKCSHGHMWDRCCVTLVVAATPMTRTCAGCHRKSLSVDQIVETDLMSGMVAFPSSRQEGESPHPVLTSLLQASRTCLFCSCRLFERARSLMVD